MKYLKMLGLAAVAAMAMTAFTAGTASATTLEVGDTTQNATVSIEASLTPGTSAILSRTDGSVANTCTTSTVDGHTTSPFTSEGTKEITGTIDVLEFPNCERPVTTHKQGLLHVGWIEGTTNGTLTASNQEVTVGSIFGTLNCKTGAGVHIGILTAAPSKTGHAEIDINAVLNCGFLVPSASWKGTYIVTSPTGLGVEK